MKKLLFFLMIFTFLFSSLVYAETTYPNFGGYNGDFYSGDSSLFNENIKNEEIADLYPLTDPQFMPLIEDLDGDGINEIVILAGRTIGIYQAEQTQSGIEISGVGGYSTSASIDGDYWSNMIIYDIDADNIKEIIVHSQEEGWIYIINWNGTVATDEGFDYNTAWNSGDSIRSADSMIGCGDSDGCVIIYNDKNRWDAIGDTDLYAQQFDSSGLSGMGVSLLSSYQGYPYCLPKHKNVPYVNSFYYFTEQQTSSQRIFSLEVNSSEHIIFDSTVNPHNPTSLGISCSRGVTSFTSPTPIDYSDVDTGYELGYAFQVNVDEFKMIIYKRDLIKYDEYPENFNADGEIKSNPFVANAFPDSEESSLCVVGFEKDYGDYGRLDVLCADVQSSYSGVQSNTQFIHDFNSQTDFNISSADIYTIASHSIESKQANSMSEILTPYGILELEDRQESCTFSPCDTYMIYLNPLQEENSIISVDILNQGHEDLITLTETNLYYIDDGFINLNAYLGHCTRIQPSIDAIWKLDNYTSQESISGERNETVDSFGVIMGSDVKDSFYQTYALDTYFHEIKEEGIGVREALDVRYNFTDILEGEYHNLVFHINYNFDSEDDEDIEFYAYNYNISNWSLMFIQPSEHSAIYYSYNYTFTSPENYISGGIFQLKISDEVSVLDIGAGTDDKIKTDFMQLNINISSEGLVSQHTNEVKVRVKPVDPDTPPDIVSARVVLYVGEDNEQDTGWSSNFASGTEIPFSGLYPNEITFGSTLRIYYRDSTNYLSAPNYEDFTFIVQSAGDTTTDSNSCEGFTEEEYEDGYEECIVDSDCSGDRVCGSDNLCHEIPDTCTEGSECPTGYICVESECEQLPDSDDNNLTSAVNSFSFFAGIPILILFLLGVAYVSWHIMMNSSIPSNVKLPAIVIITFFVIGAGVAMSMISIIWLVLFIIIAIAIAGVFLSSYMRRG